MPVVYCSSTLSLTVLESLVHMSPSVLKKLEYVSVSAKVPVEVFEKREIVTIDDATKIDKKWREAPSPEKLRLYGAEWHNKKSSCILQVPSVVIPQENNYVLNPYHPDFKKIVTNTPQPFAFDPRTLK